MKILADTHTHSVHSGHAYSTIMENAKAAADKGLQLLALTDHAPAMPNTTSHAFFANMHIIPKELFGIRILKGVELNILDYEGKLDLQEAILSKLDISIASLHTPCITPGTKKENTSACICAMENPMVDILGHPGDPRYPMDFREVFRVAKRTGTLLEINNASLVQGGFREGSEENIEYILKMSMKEDVPVIVGSDAHFCTAIGDVFYVEQVMARIGFPKDLVLNTNIQELLHTLKRNKG